MYSPINESMMHAGFLVKRDAQLGVHTDKIRKLGDFIKTTAPHPLDDQFLYKKSGKSTIEKIVFKEQDSNHHRGSQFLTNGRSLQVKVIDLPDTSIILEPTSPSPYDAGLFEGCCAILYVVDITDDYVNSLTKLCALALRAQRTAHRLPIEVFLHKADAFEEHERQDTLRDISQKVKEEMTEICEEQVDINFHLTSIFDHSIYASLSQVIQKHFNESPALEALLDMLCSNSKIDKAFLFDTSRKLYVAADSSPFGIRSFELASVVLDVICDFDNVYHQKTTSIPKQKEATEEESSTKALRCSAHGEIRLANGIVIGYSQVNEFLSILYLINMENHSGKSDQVMHNVLVAKETILKVLSSSTL